MLLVLNFFFLLSNLNHRQLHCYKSLPETRKVLVFVFQNLKWNCDLVVYFLYAIVKMFNVHLLKNINQFDQNG